MSVIKNHDLTQIKAAGALGKPILKALVQSNKFNITVLTRSTSTSSHTYPSSVTVLPVNFDSIPSLTAALQSQKIDAIVSSVGVDGLLGQKLLIDTALAAGAVAAKNPSFTYTYIRNGAFLDWGLEYNFILNISSGKPSIYDGGDKLFSATTLETIAQSVVAVLTKFEETKNRALYIQDLQTSQNRLLSIVKKISPEKKWEVVPVETADIIKSSDEKLARGDVTMEVMAGYIIAWIFGERLESDWKKTDNELLGLKEKTVAELEAIVKKYVK
ncbi:hypothetical protein BPOR_0469g00020 [Botrytis porri]|uniref:NmrA-like domain-containing protein n=1 Tax=Botrytis porri TaxID=87229 RepID=A0A4Z1KFD8_9HELO|nr:hypothetical protein BPOR_0469g00020 [Botrytis porri]